jgi:alkylation response protein AidB-like acyl-CoA dehydrogenase
MDFELSDEQELLVENVTEFCKRHINEDIIKKIYDEHHIPAELSKAYMDAGFAMIGVPEEYGGTPASYLTRALLYEAINHVVACYLPCFGGDTIMINDIIEFGNPDQIKLCVDYFKETGKPMFCMGISEPCAGSDNASMTTFTTKQADGTYRMNGTKAWVTDGTERDYAIIVAKDEDPSPTNRSVSLWFVPTDRKGMSFSPYEKIGFKSATFNDMYLDNVVVYEEDRLGAQGEGFKLMMKNFEWERALIGAQSIGWAQAALDDAAAYASERSTFGKPIGHHQLIQEKLTEAEIALETARLLLYKVCWKLDKGLSIQLDCALLKRYACTAATKVASECLQIFGALGYTSETRVGRIWIDCRGAEIGGGTNEIMVHIAGRQLLKKYKKQ